MTAPTHGGTRPNAGRKPGKTRVTISVSVTPSAAARIRSVAKKRGASVSSLADSAFKEI